MEPSRAGGRRVAGALGIDVGTQGLSVVFVGHDGELVGRGEGAYAMTPGLPLGHYEQQPADWEHALSVAMGGLHAQLAQAGLSADVEAVGVAGQMHGEVLVGGGGEVLAPARLWCDTRNAEEASELGQRLGAKIPKRLTLARLLWTTRERTELAALAQRVATPAAWLHWRLSGRWSVGVGEASGMLPLDERPDDPRGGALDYDPRALAAFESLSPRPRVEGRARPLRDRLPTIRYAGTEAGRLSAHGAKLLGIPAGVPMAPPEGDQPAALVGARVTEPGTAALSLGTSVCANTLAARPLVGGFRSVDSFCAVDGRALLMVFLRNGTPFLNSVVGLVTDAGGGDAGFEQVLPQLLAARPDCGGLLALPFVDDEPGLGIEPSGGAAFAGLRADNMSPGNMAKAALLGTLFNLRIGERPLVEHGVAPRRMVLSGGLTRSPGVGQLIADVCGVRTEVPVEAPEGTAYGAACLAHFVLERQSEPGLTLTESVTRRGPGSGQVFEPEPERHAEYARGLERYERLLGRVQQRG